MYPYSLVLDKLCKYRHGDAFDFLPEALMRPLVKTQVNEDKSESVDLVHPMAAVLASKNTDAIEEFFHIFHPVTGERYFKEIQINTSGWDNVQLTNDKTVSPFSKEGTILDGRLLVLLDELKDKQQIVTAISRLYHPRINPYDTFTQCTSNYWVPDENMDAHTIHAHLFLKWLSYSLSHRTDTKFVDFDSWNPSIKKYLPAPAERSSFWQNWDMTTAPFPKRTSPLSLKTTISKDNKTYVLIESDMEDADDNDNYWREQQEHHKTEIPSFETFWMDCVIQQLVNTDEWEKDPKSNRLLSGDFNDLINETFFVRFIEFINSGNRYNPDDCCHENVRHSDLIRKKECLINAYGFPQFMSKEDSTFGFHSTIHACHDIWYLNYDLNNPNHLRQTLVQECAELEAHGFTLSPTLLSKGLDHPFHIQFVETFETGENEEPWMLEAFDFSTLCSYASLYHYLNEKNHFIYIQLQNHLKKLDISLLAEKWTDMVLSSCVFNSEKRYNSLFSFKRQGSNGHSLLFIQSLSFLFNLFDHEERFELLNKIDSNMAKKCENKTKIAWDTESSCRSQESALAKIWASIHDVYLENTLIISEKPPKHKLTELRF